MARHPGNAHWPTLAILSAVYLVWGVVASLNDILIPYLKSEFSLSFSAATRVQLVFYFAYFLLSIPCGLLARRHGYRFGILAGLSVLFGGCLAMLAASQSGSYPLVLAAVFVLASGITLLQVSANPFATSLGAARTAASRLTLVQSFHSLGTTIGPWAGAVLIFSLGAVLGGIRPGGGIWLPYAGLAVIVAAIGFAFARLERSSTPVAAGPVEWNPLPLMRRNRRLLPGTLGIFCYVGAEIAIASLMVNFLGHPDVAGLDPASAGKWVSVYWGGALLGRLIGIGLLRVFDPRRLLTAWAVIAALLLSIAVLSGGVPSAAAILGIGFFNSIMFPTVFALSIAHSPAEDAPAASGVLCLGIVGGAVVTQAQGLLADAVGIQASYVLPLCCYLYLVVLAAGIFKPGEAGVSPRTPAA